MTFEEFLTKKKIDRAQFQTAEPGLFTEFQSHYSQMGPKSFDHSKKFLFNKLRRAYHLKEEPKPAIVRDAPAAVKETFEVNEIASQAEPLLSPSVEATVYTPRFRAGGIVKKEEAESGKLKTESGSADEPKPAYVPRFKSPATTKQEPPQTNPAPSDLLPQTSDPSPQATDKPKPAYVPRFKSPAATKQEPPQTNPAPSDFLPQTSDPKPAYVPRFKAAATKPAEEPKDEDTSDKS